ncbi:MAG: YraN family protein, partial [Candidatus Yanofskybacteria bacterium]|nr:YraN family protein [Candidatus Yanofskybacteria bacterium]
MDHRELGFLAENIAARHLESGGYKILEKNYRKPWGEIDIIATKEDAVVFVEVKANGRESAGFDPESRVNWNKIARIKRTAALYLEYEMGSMEQEWQID